MLILPLLAWLPLLLLSTFDGKLLPGSVETPFLLDLSAHIRLLVALPLFILAARLGEARILPTLQQFLARRIVLGRLDPTVRIGSCIRVQAWRFVVPDL